MHSSYWRQWDTKHEKTINITKFWYETKHENKRTISVKNRKKKSYTANMSLFSIAVSLSECKEMCFNENKNISEFNQKKFSWSKIFAFFLKFPVDD